MHNFPNQFLYDRFGIDMTNLPDQPAELVSDQDILPEEAGIARYAKVANMVAVIRRLAFRNGMVKELQDTLVGMKFGIYDARTDEFVPFENYHIVQRADQGFEFIHSANNTVVGSLTPEGVISGFREELVRCISPEQVSICVNINSTIVGAEGMIPAKMLDVELVRNDGYTISGYIR
jgi:hypothetical protein